MKSILRATAILGSSSLVSIIVGLFSSKAWAVLLGPSGLGNMGLLQSLVGLAGLLAGMGVGSGLVRAGANALTRDDLRRVSALWKAAWLLLWVIGGLTLLLMTMFRVPISQWMLGGPEHSDSVVLAGFALFFSLASGIQTSILNAYHRVGALARIGILNSAVGTGLSLALVWRLHERGIGPAVMANLVTSWAVSRYYLRQEANQKLPSPSSAEVLAAVRSLLRFGVPFTASMLVGTGVQLALPSLVLHTLGTESVGFYRAAMAVSVNYLGFLLIAMGQDYYPRLSAVHDQPDLLVELVNQQHRLVMLLGVPMILGVLALAPYLVPLIYSRQFYPAVDVLEWQLLGDIFKFSSWTMAFVILARSGSFIYFCTELVAGLTMLTTSWLGVHWFGLSGLGIGFLATYVVYYIVVWIIVRRDIALVWTAANKRMLLGTVLAAVVIRVLPFANLDSLRTPVALLFALLASVASLYISWLEVRGVQHARAI